jgi:rSAM/selenodomain-associated transferase 1
VNVALLILTKTPEPGRSKTRLCPPCTAEEAAILAEAALLDTLDAGERAAGLGRRVLALDGDVGPRIPRGWEIVPQRGNGQAERIANAFEDVGGPAFLVGMDTPQLTGALLTRSAERLLDTGVGAVLGPACDGGYWAIGLREPDRRVFEGVPMSTAWTLASQRRRLQGLGIAYRELPELRDVDTFDDALEVAALAPGTRFAGALASLGETSVTLVGRA